MPKFVIEREVLKAGSWDRDQQVGAARKSCDVLNQLGTGIQWLHSYVTGDKIYCIYIAENEGLVMEHAKKAGFPANRVSKIEYVLEPVMSEG